MNLKDLSPEERALLKAELEAEEKAVLEQKQQRRKEYEQFKDEYVRKNIQKLQNLSSEMLRVRDEVFSESETLIAMKNELYNVKSERKSDTLSTTDGSMTITLGNRTNEGWDDTVDVGIAKVKEFMGSLAKDETSAALVEAIMRLVSKDSKGNLKASRVLELEKLASRTQDKTFLEGISIIKQAYRPKPSCQFIEATIRDIEGNEVNIPLSLSALKSKKHETNSTTI